jgi:hypothetical protein
VKKYLKIINLILRVKRFVTESKWQMKAGRFTDEDLNMLTKPPAPPVKSEGNGEGRTFNTVEFKKKF